MQPILPVTVSIKKIKGAAGLCYGDSDGIAWCGLTLRLVHTEQLSHPRRNIDGRHL